MRNDQGVQKQDGRFGFLKTRARAREHRRGLDAGRGIGGTEAETGRRFQAAMSGVAAASACIFGSLRIMRAI